MVLGEPCLFYFFLGGGGVIKGVSYLVGVLAGTSMGVSVGVSVSLLIGGITLEGRVPRIALRQDKQYLYFGHLFPVRQGLFPCSTALSHRAGPVPQDFGFVLWAGVWHSTSAVQALRWG